MRSLLEDERPYVDAFLDPDDLLECACGGWAEPKKETITFCCLGRDITVRDIPVYKCPNCKESMTSGFIDVRIEELLADAIKNNLSEIEFSE